MRNRKVVVALGMVYVLLFFGLTTAFAQRTVNVSMTNGLRFDPQDLVIQAGDTVLWTNTSTIFPHTATESESKNYVQGFNSGSLPRKWLHPGDTFQFTFTTPGTYPYHCVLHQGFGMVGTVTVNGPAVSSQYLFTAAPIADADQVLVRWNVPRNKERVGFKVLRSTGWDQQFVEVSDGIVKAMIETDRGEEYRFVDANIVGDTQYFYVIEEVRLDGQASFRGPAIARPR